MSPVDALKSVLNQTHGVRLAVLFGSASRRGPGAAGDLDVGVSVVPGVEIFITALQVELERTAGRPVDLVVLEDAPALLRFEIARDGVVLVDWTDHGWADFRARAMIDWWDWAPTARLMHRVMAERLREEAANGQA